MKPFELPLIFAVGLVCSNIVQARVIELSVYEIAAQSRWRFKKQATVGELAAMKRDFFSKAYQSCAERGEKLAKKYPAILVHVQRQRLECLSEWLQKDKRAFSELEELLGVFDAKKSWRLYGPAAESVRKSYAQGKLSLFREQIRRDRSRAWKIFEGLTKYSDDLEQESRAQFYQLAGELAFIDQKFLLALQLYEQSLSLSSNSELKKKFQSLKRQFMAGSKEQGRRAVLEPLDASLQIGIEEAKLFQRMQTAVSLGDLVPAVEDGILILQRFPGSSSSTWANSQITEIFLRVIAQKSENYRMMKERILVQLLKVDNDRQLEWAEKAFSQTEYAESLLLAETAVEGMAGRVAQERALWVAGRSAQLLGDSQRAKKHFLALDAGFAGSHTSHRALFQLGLIDLRAGEYSAASAHFERVVAMTSDRQLQLKSLYWQWRAAQKLNKDRAQETWERLVNDYPLSYYGLVARAERNEGLVGFTALKNPPRPKAEYPDHEVQTRNRFKILADAGWFEEAAQELSALVESRSSDHQLVRASEWAAAFDYPKALKILEDFWAANIFNISLNSLKVGFAKEFAFAVGKVSQSLKLDSFLLYALIKEKSAFNPNLVGPLGEMGLLQLPKPTLLRIAREKYKSKKVFNDSELIGVELNIELGGLYLKNLTSRFGGDWLMALTAYHLGEEELRNWVAKRNFTPSVGVLESNDPLAFIWIDELPWSQTADQVKKILRSALIYRTLEEGPIKVGFPFWITPST